MVTQSYLTLSMTHFVVCMRIVLNRSTGILYGIGLHPEVTSASGISGILGLAHFPTSAGARHVLLIKWVGYVLSPRETDADVYGHHHCVSTLRRWRTSIPRLLAVAMLSSHILWSCPMWWASSSQSLSISPSSVERVERPPTKTCKNTSHVVNSNQFLWIDIYMDIFDLYLMATWCVRMISIGRVM